MSSPAPESVIFGRFKLAVTSGNAKAIIDLPLSAQDAAKVRDNAARLIMAAAYFGHADVLKNLRTMHRMTKRDACATENVALRMAATNGYVAVLKELRVGYGLTAKDARALGNRALIEAARHGHVDVLRELREGYGLTAKDARSQRNGAIVFAAQEGHPAVLRELREGYGLTAEDANEEVSSRAIAHGRTDVLRELRKSYGFTAETLHSSRLNKLNILLCIREGHMKTIRFFRDELGFTLVDALNFDMFSAAFDAFRDRELEFVPLRELCEMFNFDENTETSHLPVSQERVARIKLLMRAAAQDGFNITKCEVCSLLDCSNACLSRQENAVRMQIYSQCENEAEALFGAFNAISKLDFAALGLPQNNKCAICTSPLVVAFSAFDKKPKRVCQVALARVDGCVCRRIYHRECINKWASSREFSRRTQCPFCCTGIFSNTEFLELQTGDELSLLAKHFA